MLRLLCLFLTFVSASALVVSPLMAPAQASQRAAVSPMMACNGGKGGKGGMSPPKDKNRRGKLGRLIQAVRVFYFAYIAARSLSLLVSFLARHTPCLALVSCETPLELNPFL